MHEIIFVHSAITKDPIWFDVSSLLISLVKYMHLLVLCKVLYRPGGFETFRLSMTIKWKYGLMDHQLSIFQVELPDLRWTAVFLFEWKEKKNYLLYFICIISNNTKNILNTKAGASFLKLSFLFFSMKISKVEICNWNLLIVY